MHLQPFSEAFAAPGPVATACLDVSRDIENAAAQLDLRWRGLRDELEQEGAPAGVLEVLRERLTQEVGLAGGWGRVVAANADGVLVDRVFPGRPRAHGAWSALPHLMPLLTVEAAAVAHIIVEADRVGADITVSARSGTWEESVEGEEHHIRKVNVGGWAHLRYHHGVENLWEQNATNVAQRIDRLVTESGAEVIAVTGDVRATQLVRDNVSEKTRELVHVLDGGGRAAGASTQRLMEAVTALTEQRALERAKAIVGQFVEQRETGGRAVSGLAATIEALRRAQVETLLVPPDWDDHEPAWFGPEPGVIGLKSDEVTAFGVAEPQQAPVVDVVLRAAATTDASLLVVPEHVLRLDGEPAALLRFVDASTPSTTPSPTTPSPTTPSPTTPSPTTPSPTTPSPTRQEGNV